MRRVTVLSTNGFKSLSLIGYHYATRPIIRINGVNRRFHQLQIYARWKSAVIDGANAGFATRSHQSAIRGVPAKRLGSRSTNGDQPCISSFTSIVFLAVTNSRQIKSTMYRSRLYATTSSTSSHVNDSVQEDKPDPGTVIVSPVSSQQISAGCFDMSLILRRQSG